MDNFKTVNDTLGHVTGDKCLLNLTEFFMKNKRRADLFGRFGGDEFIMVMPNLSASEAIKAMEFHRKSIEEKSNPHFTVTSGIATYPYDGSTFDELIASADHALYMAKDAGKNKVYYTGNYK
ncbi:MAG: GGDEF domain-containing protein [Bacillota bacterium]|nr:GGDEF domain-containing protein [Bacillota bacterium]